MTDHWIFWALLSALFAALTALLTKLGVSGMDSNLATALRTTVVLALSWAVAAATGAVAKSGGWRHLDVRGIGLLVASGLATGLSWLCYFRALQLGPVSQVAPVDKLSVALTLALALTLLGEKFTWQQWVGAGLIVGGTLLVTFFPPAAR